jgi:hypothetical protein
MRKGSAWIWALVITVIITIVGGIALWKFPRKILPVELGLEKANITEIENFRDMPLPSTLQVKYNSSTKVIIEDFPSEGSENVEIYKLGNDIRCAVGKENYYFLNGTYILCEFKNETWECEALGRGISRTMKDYTDAIKNGPTSFFTEVWKIVQYPENITLKGAKDIKILGRPAKCFYLDACKLWEEYGFPLAERFECEKSEVTYCFDVEYGIILKAEEYVKGNVITTYKTPHEHRYTLTISSLSFEPPSSEQLQIVGKMEKIKVATNSWCGFYTIYVYVKNLGYETINVDDIKVELLEVPGKVEKLEWGAKQILPGGTAGLKVSFYEKEGSKNYKIKLIDPVGKVHYEEGSCT